MLMIASLFLLPGCNKSISVFEHGEATTEYIETRPSGEYKSGSIMEDMHTAFFDFRLEGCSAKQYFDMNNQVYKLEEGYQFLVVDISITNTSNQSIDMYLDDFLLTADGEIKDYGYGYTETSKEGFMEDSISISPGETIQRKILFKAEVAEIYTLIYDEFYEDGFQGNSYFVEFSVES